MSSSRNSGMLKILSLFPFAWRMCPIFSGRFRSLTFRFASSETRNPQAYMRLIISFDFSFLISLRSFFISSFDRVVGSRFSFLGRLIDAVMSFPMIDEKAYLIAARKRIVDVADLSESFSARKFFRSSVVIFSGDFSVKFSRF